MLRRIAPAAVIVLFLLSGLGVYLYSRPEVADLPDFDEPATACDVPLDLLERVANGYYPGRSGDILLIEQPKVQPQGTRHSTPYPSTQDVPLVLYGPGFIRSGAAPDREATVADLAPTFAELLRFEGFPQRDGRVLSEALLPRTKRNGVPRLLMTIMWDGGGDNVLEKWSDQWPHLRRMMDEGANYPNATVGSAPSITPAVHATIGTGAFPSSHGLPDNFMRVGGRIIDPYEGHTPRYLKEQTLGDLWDVANGNEPLLGMLARDAWHLGMLGHGTNSPGGDADIAVLDILGGTEFHTFEEFYELPEYVKGKEGLQEFADVVDARDGDTDGKWLGNVISANDQHVRYTPAWSMFQTAVMLRILAEEGFGDDQMPDLFYTNYKSTDLAGHEWNMVEPEVRDDLEEQDRQLRVVRDALDRTIGPRNYVLAVTADHGMMPPAATQHNYEIDEHAIKRHIHEEFDLENPDVDLVDANRGYQLFLDPDELIANDVTIEDVVEFLRDYTIEDNATVPDAISAEIEPHADEPMFYAVLTPKELREAVACARQKDG